MHNFLLEASSEASLFESVSQTNLQSAKIKKSSTSYSIPWQQLVEFPFTCLNLLIIILKRFLFGFWCIRFMVVINWMPIWFLHYAHKCAWFHYENKWLALMHFVYIRVDVNGTAAEQSKANKRRETHTYAMQMCILNTCHFSILYIIQCCLLLCSTQFYFNIILKDKNIARE